MRFQRHSELEGKHAFLAPSSYHWLNYDEDHLRERFKTAMNAQLGTELHLFAHEAIRLGIRLPDDGATLSRYVNDAIDMGMHCEVPLYFSRNCFGHADAICFDEITLNIHDLKNGVTPADHRQLEIYAALFCFEYVKTPFEIDIELRIYQNDQVQVTHPYPETIAHIMNKIVQFDQVIEEMRRGGSV